VIGQAQPLPLGVLEIENGASCSFENAARLDALLSQMLSPPFKTFDPVHAQAGAGDAIGAALFALYRPVEKGDVGTGRSQPVRIEQVVGACVVLVDGLLDEPKPERVGVEAPVAGRIGGNGCQMVQPCQFQCHMCASFRNGVAVGGYIGQG